MTNSNKNQSNTKKSSIVAMVIGKTFSMILTTLLAIFFQIIWFEAMAVVKGDQYSLNKIGKISNVDEKYIQIKLPNKLQNSSILLAIYINKLINHNNYFISKIDNNNLKILIQIYINKCISYFAIIYKSILIVANRFLIFAFNLPFLIAMLFVSCIDGLGQRDIRKFKGARESTLVFHKVKPLTGLVFFTSLFIYLASPLPIQPWVIIMPMISLVSMLVMISITNFKKYA